MANFKKKLNTLLSMIIIAATISFSITVVQVQAAGTITNDATNKLLTITSGNISMMVDYNQKCKISSIKMGSGQVEAMDAAGGTSGMELPNGNIWSSSIQSQTGNQWVYVDLGEVYTVRGVTLVPRIVNGTVYCFPQDFSFQYSIDGTSWYNAPGASRTDYANPVNDNGEHFDFDSPVNARYIKLIGTKFRTDTGGAYYMQIAKMYVNAGSGITPRIAAAASSEASPDFVAVRAIDSNGGTFWSSTAQTQTGSQWLTVDMGTNYSFNKVTLFPRLINGKAYCFPQDFKLQWSTDGTTWSDIPGQLYTDYQAPDGSGEMLDFDSPVNARYLRIVGTKFRQDDTGTYYMQLSDVYVYPDTTTVARVSASASSEALPAASAIDSSTAYVWSSALQNNQTGSEWLSVDMGCNNQVRQIKLVPRTINGTPYCFPEDFKFQYGTDGTTWTDVPGGSYTAYPNPANNNGEIFTFDNTVNARYIRVLGTKFRMDDTSHYYMQIAEMYAFYKANIVMGIAAAASSQADPAFAPGNILGSTYVPVSTAVLANSPTVSVSGNVATISNISYGTSDITVTETWTITANDSDIDLRVQKTYDWLTGAYNSLYSKTLSNAFVTDRFDVVDVESGAGYLLQEENSAKRGIQRKFGKDDWMSMGRGGKFSNGLWIDLIDKSDNLILNITADTTLKGGTEVYRRMSGSFPLLVDHVVSPNNIPRTEVPGVMTTLGFSMESESPMNNRHGYGKITVSDLQTDAVAYKYKVIGNLNKYYADPMTLPAASNMNTARFLTFLEDLGRYAQWDYGQTDTMPYDLAPWTAAWYESLTKGLQIGDGNPAIIENEKRAVDWWINHGGQQASGHVYGVYQNNYIYNDAYENEGGYVNLICQIFDVSGDTTWLNTVKDSARAALNYGMSTDTDGDGLIEGKYPYTTVGDHFGASWNDILNVSHEDGYSNAIFHGALRRWADIEANVLNDSTRANTYNNFANMLKTTYNKDTSQGGLWSSLHNSFVFWRDSDGTIHGDVKHIQVNAMAAYFGVADKPRVKKIFTEPFDGYDSVEDFLTENNCKGIPANLFSFQPEEMKLWFNFGTFENGGAFAQNLLELQRAYAAMGISTNIGQHTKDLIDFALDRMDLWWHRDVPSWDFASQSGHGCHWQMDSIAWPAGGLIVDTLGINPKYNCLEIKPALSDDSFNGTVVNYTMRAKKYNITYNSLTQRTIVLPSGAEPVKMSWKNLDPNSTYSVTDVKTGGGTTNVNLTTDTDGVMTYNLNDSAGGTHTITIAFVSYGEFPRVAASASTNSSAAGAAIDRDGVYTAWTSTQQNQTGNEWLTVDMGANYNTRVVKLVPRTINGTPYCFPEDFKFQYSTDGTSWTDVPQQSYTGYPNPANGNGQTFTFGSAVNARYIKLVGTKFRQDNAGAYYMQMAEMYLYP